MSETNDTIREEILEHMAKAFFASAWADYSEQVGPHYPTGCEIMDEMPEEIDPAATKAAQDLAECLEKQHGLPLAEIFTKAAAISEVDNTGDRERSAEMFGHYAAMGAMGQGVSLHDALGRKAAEFVNTSSCHMEFTYFDLDGENFPIPDETVGE